MHGGPCASWLESVERPETWAWKRRSSDATRSFACCEQLHAAERERKLRVVAVTGQAGMGKSRLAWELEKYLDGLAGPQLYYWHQGRSPSYGEGVTYWALGEMVRRRARIAEGEGPQTREKLRATLDEFVPDPDERRWLEPALGALLGVQEPDWDQREQLFSAWRTFLERVADKGPSVFVFEDLQWADTGMLDFLDHMLDWSRDRPMLIVTLARPEFLERRPNFGRGHRAFSSLHLEPLSEAAMTELLRGIAPGLGDDDVARIVARAEGLPLYTIETVRALVDSGHLVRNGDVYEPTGDLPVLDIPPTLRALIASRLDAIDPADRSLLQDGAVIGQVFSVPALAAIAGAALTRTSTMRLRAMAVKELVALENDPRSPERGQYRFTQGLIREVAYGTLSKRERRAKHVAAARYFEQLGRRGTCGRPGQSLSRGLRGSARGGGGRRGGRTGTSRPSRRGRAGRASPLPRTGSGVPGEGPRGDFRRAGPNRREPAGGWISDIHRTARSCRGAFPGRAGVAGGQRRQGPIGGNRRATGADASLRIQDR